MRSPTDQQRFETLVRPLLGRLLGFSLRLTRDSAAAEDLVQQSLLTGLMRVHQLRAGAAFGVWMNRIVYRTHIDNRRKHTEEPVDPGTIDNVIPIDARGPLAELEGRRAAARILAALDRLPAQQREVLWLVDGQGFKFAEAAEILEIPVGTAASRVMRGRLALRASLHNLALDAGVIR